MFSLSNGLTLLRAPLAFLFLLESPGIRIMAIILAMLTDSIDGYLARKFSNTSKLGAILDPLMDKFFVFFILGVFLLESKLTLWQACSMISRDFSLCIFATYLAISGGWQAFKFYSIRWGKITTALQFFVLIALTLNLPISPVIFVLFILFGTLAFIELFRTKITRRYRARNK
jgi:CDP-diacylglycerol---glycerol-3-phosphate 3-phosphatidyltransferase